MKVIHYDTDEKEIKNAVQEISTKFPTFGMDYSMTTMFRDGCLHLDAKIPNKPGKSIVVVLDEKETGHLRETLNQLHKDREQMTTKLIGELDRMGYHDIINRNMEEIQTNLSRYRSDLAKGEQL